MKKSKKLLVIILLAVMLLPVTGCTKYLQDSDGKNIQNKETGQNAVKNILCQPTDKEMIKIYKENKIDVEELPKCTELSIVSGGYEGIWTTIFVKPLAWVIIFIGKHLNNFGLGLIITSLLIRLIAYPFTNKTAMQSELIKKAQPELDRLEKKYANKDLNDQSVMMMKSQEMMAIYKKYNINPLSGCLFSFIQLPLFIAFLEAINRVPALFEGTFLGLHLGTSPMVGIKNGNWWYLIIIILVGLTTYFSFKMNNKDMPAANTNDVKNQTNMMMNVFVVMIDVMSIFMTTALGIYWITTNLFTIFQNLVVKRRIKK
jgi:YidC/Oxa1 family membrane protein insertase